MRQKKKTEDSKLEQEKQEACVKCSKLQNGRHSSFEETETQAKQTTLSTLKSVLKRSSSHKKEKVNKTQEKLVPKDVQIVGKKTKNRVQFDETQNKYFEADYVILIHEEDYDLDDYYDEGSPFDDEDDDGYDDGLAGPKICCSNPNCNNMITLTNYSDYGYPSNGLEDFKFSRPADRDRYDFSSHYYDVNYEEINQNLKKSSTNTTNRCENEKCQNCNNYFDFEVEPKLDSGQDFGDQVTLSPPEGYKDGGSQCCPHHGLQFHNSVIDIAREDAGGQSIEFQNENTPSDEEDTQQFEENESINQDDEKISDDRKEELENNMVQEEKQEKPKQRFIVETITMTTVTERRIVREASDSNSDEVLAVEDSKRSGILKGGKFWKNSTEKASEKTVNYNETVNIQETNEKINEEQIMSDKKEDETPPSEDKKPFELALGDGEELTKLNPEDAVSPESTELTLTFKLGQHLMVANSLKPNSAMRQLFPSPRFLSPPPLEDGDGTEINKPMPPKQFLVTAESLRLFEEAKNSKILGNINSEESGQNFIAIMPPISKNEEDAQSNRIHKTIERNTLRRSLIKYSYEFRNKRLLEKKKNENSLEERIRQLTCGIDDEEPQEETKNESENEMPPRSSPQGEESKETSNLLSVDVKSLRHIDTVSPSSTSSSGSSTYKKLTDLFSRKTNPPSVVEDINKNIKSETLQCDLVLNSQNINNYTLNSHAPRNTLIGAKNVLPRMPLMTDKKQFLSPLTACVNPENKERYRLIEGGVRCQVSDERPKYSLQDIDEGLRETEQKKLGMQPDVIAETPQNETPNDELALFVQQDASRIEKLKKKYSAADDKSDDEDDYGFNKRPLVKGIKQKFNPADEYHQQNQSPQTSGSLNCNPKTTITTTTAVSNTTWPYYSQENVDPKHRMAYMPKPTENSQQAFYGNPQDYRGYTEVGSANYVEYQGQQRINYVNHAQQNMYLTSNTIYRCQPVRFGNNGHSELSNYQFRHPPHSPPPMRRIMITPQPNFIPTEDGRIRNVENRPFVQRNGESLNYSTAIAENNKSNVGLPTEVASKVGSIQQIENAKNQESLLHKRIVPPNVHNPCVQMKFSPINYHQGAMPTASIRFSASCSPHPVVDESNVIIEPHYSTFPHPSNQNTVGVIRVGQGQQMIRVPVPYSTGTPVQVHLMAGRLGRCDSPQRPSSPQGSTKVPMQPYNQYLIAKGTQTAQAQSFPVPTKLAPDGAPPLEPMKTVDFEKQGKAIAEELQNRQKLILSRTSSQENNYQNRLPQTNSTPLNLLSHQERGVPEGAASSSIQDSQPLNEENSTVAAATPAPGNTIYYTMNV